MLHFCEDLGPAPLAATAAGLLCTDGGLFPPRGRGLGLKTREIVKAVFVTWDEGKHCAPAPPEAAPAPGMPRNHAEVLC